MSRYSVQVKQSNGEMYFGAIEGGITREQAERMLRNQYPGVTLTYNASINCFLGECPVIAQHVEEDFPLPSTEEALLPSSTEDVRRDASTLLTANGGEELLPLPPTLNFDPPGKRREKKSAPAAPVPVVSAHGEEALPLPALTFA